ncbi:cytochrome P460 family protein [Sphingomonas montana]|uniref:cytochrome P460 family protein n=1 Tax=Sphingomonas montana TaxID=1843236 RepID=UPI0019CFF041|nr:cytochrome P460 family protein [Sphingomonas montana]
MAATALIAGCTSAAGDETRSAAPGLPAPGVQLIFNEQGQAALPKGYRNWVHAYTSWEAITTTILDGTVTKTPELHSVYVEPNSYRVFMRTGKWPEGSLMVKEFSTTNTDPKDCSGPPAFTCKLGASTVIFPRERTGIGVMLKDNARYPGEPGGWAYFSFGHQAPPYQKVSPARGRAQCAQCHIDNVGPKQDYVWSVKLNQPGFRRDGDNARRNLEAALAE